MLQQFVALIRVVKIVSFNVALIGVDFWMEDETSNVWFIPNWIMMIFFPSARNSK